MYPPSPNGGPPVHGGPPERSDDKDPSPRDGIASEGAQRLSEAVSGGGPSDSRPMG